MKNVINLFLTSKINLTFILGKLCFVMIISDDVKLIKSKAIFFEEQSKNIQNEIKAFCEPMSFVYCDVIFDIPEQLFMVKSFSSQIKGKNLDYVVKTKLESELHHGGVK